MMNLDDKYPSELNAFIIQFLGNIFMRFDLIYEKYQDCIQNDGTLIRRNPSLISDDISWFSIVSSNAFTVGDIGEFKIKCNKPGFDSIGIMSNTDIIKEKNRYHIRVKSYIYYYHGNGNLYETGGAHMDNQTNVTGFEKDDIITVKVDCIAWTVIFLKNGEMVGTVKEIEPNNTYYPFIGTNSDDVEYELIV